MSKRYWLAVAAYVLPTFPLGYFWHLTWFAASYDRLAVFRPDMIIPLGLSAMLIQGLAYAWLYPRLFETTDWLAGAVRFGALFGLLAWSFLVLPTAAKYRMASWVEFALLETGFTVLQYAVVAPLIALAWRGEASVRRALPA
jgi:hypothetical protein